MQEENNNIKTPEYYKKLAKISMLYGAGSILWLFLLFVIDGWTEFNISFLIETIFFRGLAGILAVVGIISGIKSLKAERQNSMIGILFCIIGLMLSLVFYLLLFG